MEWQLVEVGGGDVVEGGEQLSVVFFFEENWHFSTKLMKVEISVVRGAYLTLFNETLTYLSRKKIGGLSELRGKHGGLK